MQRIQPTFYNNYKWNMCACMCAKALQLCPTLCDPMDCSTPQAPLFMGFSRQEYWSWLPCPPPGDLPDPEVKTKFLASAVLADVSLSTSTTWEAHKWNRIYKMFESFCN